MIPKIEYTFGELIEHIRNNPDPEIRELAANMLYMMGKKSVLVTQCADDLWASSVAVT